MTDSNQQSELSKEQIDSVITLYTAGQYQEAINQIKILNQSYPNTPFLFNLIGACYKSLGQLEGSAKMFETAVNLKPDYAEAHKNLGITLKDLGQLDAAVGSLSKAIAIDPSYVDAHYNLAITFKDLNQLDAAVKSYQKVIEINPNFAQAYNNLGNLMKDLGQADVAIKNYQKAIEINPSFAHAYNNLGNAFKDLGQLKEAVTNYQKAIEKNPDFSEAHNNLGNAFKDLYKFDDAVKSYQRAVEINPKFAAVYYNLGTVFKKINQREKLLTLFENAYLLDPDMDFILGDLLTARMQFCNWSEFTDLLKNLQKKLTENKKVVDPFNLLGLIDDPALQKNAAQIFSEYHNLKKNTLYKIKPYAKKSKIRIGYFSADFHNHATMHLMAEFFELHDKELFEIFAFSFGPEKIDNWRERAISSFDDFIDVRDKTDQEVSLMSKKLEIDIAVDLKGFTKDCRPNIFAEFCAPVQVSYLGYPGTIGAEHIHYLIADQTLIPEDSQNLYSEKIVYMPNTYQVNMATRDVSVVSLSRNALGLPSDGFVFCCFNNTYKITPSTFDSWMQMLQAVDGSVLWLFESNQNSVKNLIKETKKYGINENRLVFASHMPINQHLNRIRLADLFLDTLPYNAHTTSSDALRMGIPVLTCIGKSFASRVAASLLNAVNLPELITHTPKEYEALAIDLATHPEKLKVIKDKLADNLSTAPLFDTKRFTKNIESAYTQMYERSQQGLEPDHIYVEE
jgi:predicted O-linked N-acetylglucosamine transferase (SPINDLY family)